RLEACQAHQVDRGLGHLSPSEHAVFVGHVREQVAGSDEIVGRRFFGCEQSQRDRPVAGADARRGSVLSIYRYGRNRVQRSPCRVGGLDHRTQIEPSCSGGVDTYAYYAAPFESQQVDAGRRGIFCSQDERSARRAGIVAQREQHRLTGSERLDAFLDGGFHWHYLPRWSAKRESAGRCRKSHERRRPTRVATPLYVNSGTKSSRLPSDNGG